MLLSKKEKKKTQSTRGSHGLNSAIITLTLYPPLSSRLLALLYILLSSSPASSSSCCSSSLSPLQTVAASVLDR